LTHWRAKQVLRRLKYCVLLLIQFRHCTCGYVPAVGPRKLSHRTLSGTCLSFSLSSFFFCITIVYRDEGIHNSLMLRVGRNCEKQSCPVGMDEARCVATGMLALSLSLSIFMRLSRISADGMYGCSSIRSSKRPWRAI
jgi:hypothetical protein